jgi:hypothetical protein
MNMGARPEDLQMMRQAEELNRRMIGDRDAVRERLTRFFEVLQQYFASMEALIQDGQMLTDQLSLVDMAIDWTVVSIAGNKNRAPIEASFYRLVDELYASTDHADSRFGQDECRRIYDEARAYDRPSPAESEVVFASVHYLKSIDKDNPARIVFGLLEMLKFSEDRQGARLIEHADVVSLRELIQACVTFCIVNDVYDVGGTSIEEVMQALTGVGCAARTAAESMVRAASEEESEENEAEET